MSNKIFIFVLLGSEVGLKIKCLYDTKSEKSKFHPSKKSYVGAEKYQMCEKEFPSSMVRIK